MIHSFHAKIELIELLQQLHQQLPSLRISWLVPPPNGILRHLSNLPRLEIVPTSSNADVLIGPSEMVAEIKPANSYLIYSDNEDISTEKKIALYSLGYRCVNGRLLQRICQKLPQEQRLRILVLTNLYPPQELGGYGRSIYDFASNLRQLGHEIYVLTSNAPYLGGDLSHETNINRNLRLMGSYEGSISVVQNPVQQRLISDHNQSLLLEIIRYFQPDAALLGNLDMLGPGLPNDLVRQNIHCWHHLGFSDPSMLPFPVSCMPAHGYQPVANSLFTARSLSQALHSFQPIPVVYPGAQTHLYTDLEPQPLGGPLRLAFAGLLIGVKGPHILLEALARLKAWGIPFHCELAGGCINEDFRQKLVTYSESTGIDNDVQFLGKLARHELRKVFEQNQIFVFPSTWDEPFGISQVEALAAGLLVVSSATGGASETVHDDVNGRRFRPNDSQHLAEVLLEIYQHPREHEHLRRRGRRLAQTHFDTARESRKLSDLMINRSRHAAQ